MPIRALSAALISLLMAWMPAGAQAQSAPLFDAERLLGYAGQVLAAGIETARADALKAGTQPIPPAIRAKLADVVPAELLERVTWRVGEATSLQVQAFQQGHVAAMALGDVIVFQRREDAENNDPLWVHELVHVQQYDRWGIDGFAARYVRDHKSIEAEAYEVQAEYEKSRSTHGAPR